MSRVEMYLRSITHNVARTAVFTSMESLRNILGQFAKDLGIENGRVLNVIRRKWVDIVGPAVAAHTFPDTISNKVLTIIVDTPQWMHHLGFYREDISEKLGFSGIHAIRFRLGRLPDMTDISSGEEDVILTEEDLRFLENTVSHVRDEELKEKLRKLIVHGLTKGKGRTKD